MNEGNIEIVILLRIMGNHIKFMITSLVKMNKNN